MKIITCAGTSLLEKFYEGKMDSDYKRLKKGKRFSEWGNYPRQIKIMKENVKKEIKNVNACAELTSLYQIANKYSGEVIEVHLLATDTVVSVLAAELIREALINFQKSEPWAKEFFVYFTPEYGIDVIKGLQVEDVGKFTGEGVTNLLRRIEEITGGNYEDTVFNVTGGYKVLLPYLTILAQINEAPMYYIFEETDELITIPPLPVDFDYQLIEENYSAFEVLKKTEERNLPSVGYFKKDFEKEGDEFFDQLKRQGVLKVIKLQNGEEKVALDIFGKMLLKKYDELFGEQRRKNLFATLVELKLYEYYRGKYDRLGKNDKIVIEQGKDVKGKSGNKGEIDLYIEDETSIMAVEVKPSGRPEISGQKDSTIEKKLTRAGFKILLEDRKDKEINLVVILYGNKEPHLKELDKMRELHQKYPEETRRLKWLWLKTDKNAKSDFKWKIKDADIEEITL